MSPKINVLALQFFSISSATATESLSSSSGNCRATCKYEAWNEASSQSLGKHTFFYFYWFISLNICWAKMKSVLTFWKWWSVMNSQHFFISYKSSSFSTGVFAFEVTSSTRWITVSELLLNASAMTARKRTWEM